MTRRWVGWLGLGPLRLPIRVPAALYWVSACAALLLAAAIGLQLTSTLMVVFGPLAERLPPEELTRVGSLYMRPEQDLEAYVVGCVTSVVLMVGLPRLWNRMLHAPGLSRPERAASIGVIWLATLALGSLAAHVGLAHALRDSFDAESRLTIAGSSLLAAPALFALTVFLGFTLGLAARPPRSGGP